MMRRSAVGTMVALLVIQAACTATQSSREEILSGLEHEPRLIAIRIDETPPSRNFEVHESQAGKGAAVGAARGALGSLQGGLSTGDPFGVVLGVILMPVFAVGGAVVGAVSAEPLVHHYSLDKVQGAQPLFEAATKRANLVALLKNNLARKRSTPEGHTIRFLGTKKGAEPKARESPDVQLLARITTYSLVGELEDDPVVKLLVSGDTMVSAVWASGQYICNWSQQSSSYRLSRWSANNAELFVREIERVAAAVGGEIISAVDKDTVGCLE